MLEHANIVTTPNKLLNKPTEKIGVIDNEIKQIASILKENLRKNSDFGIGLAANQLGFNKSIIVVEYIDDENKTIIPFQTFINPEIIDKSSDTEILDEGCLSVPNIFLPIERSKKIKFKAIDLSGKRIKLTVNDLFARLVQHEVDHLSGKLFTDIVRDKLTNDYPLIKNKKIVFIGSGDFAEIILRGLILVGIKIPLSITEKGKLAGRKKVIHRTPVYETLKSFNLNVLETDDIKNNINEIKDINPDLIILADFGQIIPMEILDIPKVTSINIHPSLLPKYRGSTPIQTAILNGDKETGVSVIKMSEKIDYGEIVKQNKLEIFTTDNSYSLEIRLASLGIKTLIEVLPDLFEKKIKFIKQDNSKATLTKKIKKRDGEINWSNPAKQIERQIRAYYPWPGSFTNIGGKRFIIHQAHIDGHDLVLDIVQPEGKKPMLFTEFLKGFREKKPAWFDKIRLQS